MAKAQATSGFVYIWYDRKHKRYYVGCHWGSETDGYVCSSSWMKKAYKIRPQDFKRRIISRVNTNRQDLLNEENRWLSMIKPEEIKVRYYNLYLHEFGHWSVDEQKRAIIGEKISSKTKGKKQNFKDPVERGRKISDGKKKAFEKRVEETGSAFSDEHIEKLAEKKRGRKHTEEWKENNSKILKEQWASGSRKAKPKKEVVRRQKGERVKELWADPIWAENQRNKLKIGAKSRWHPET